MSAAALVRLAEGRTRDDRRLLASLVLTGLIVGAGVVNAWLG